MQTRSPKNTDTELQVIHGWITACIISCLGKAGMLHVAAIHSTSIFKLIDKTSQKDLSPHMHILGNIWGNMLLMNEESFIWAPCCLQC